jgi:hypothetical protein
VCVGRDCIAGSDHQNRWDLAFQREIPSATKKMGRGRIARSDYKKKVGSRVPTRDPISSEKEHQKKDWISRSQDLITEKDGISRSNARSHHHRDPISTEKDRISRSSARSHRHRKRWDLAFQREIQSAPKKITRKRSDLGYQIRKR